jgi:autotransporter adhesin
VTKNNNTGFRLSSHSDTNYGDVGDKAVDLSYSDTKNATYGATGSYSLASGYQTTASGSNSLASGYQTTASGTYSTAMGFYATASGYISTAIGKATASDYGSFAMGQHNKALSTLTEGGDRTTYSVNNTAFVIGNGTGTNNKSDAFKVMFNGDATIGNNLNVNGELKIKGELFPLEKMKLVDIVEGGVLASVTENGKTGVRLSSHSDTNYGDIGSKAVDLSYSDSENSKYGATGNNSLASGYQTKASGTYSTAMGNNTKAEAMNSIAMGNNTTAYAMNSTAIGTNSTASAFNSMAMGTGSTASAAYSMAIGLNTIASGMYSTAMGVATEARGINSTAMGNNTKATDYGSFVIGQYNDALSSVTSGGSSTAYNANNIAFVIGNGTPSAKSDAFKVKFNGDATIGNNLSIGGKLIINEKEITFEKMDKLDKLDGGILSSVTENNNTGFRLSSHSDTNYGDIGNKAVDLSYSDTKNATPRGASADYSLATGLNTTASGKNSTAMGMNTTASDYGSFVIGQYNDALSSITSGGSATDYNADNTAFVIGNGTSNAKSDAFKVKFNGNTTVSNNLTVSGDVVISSDARLKANIVSLGSTLSKLLLIDGKTYTMKKNSKQKIGVLAQDIQKVFPELVSKDENEMLAVNYQGLVPVLINALKEQHTKISRLEHLVNKLIADK